MTYDIQNGEGVEANKAAWEMLCGRLQRDPATSKESDTCTLRVAMKAMVAFASARQSLASKPPTEDVERNPALACLASLRAAISLLEKGGKKAAASDKMFAQMLVDYNSAADNFAAALSRHSLAREPATADVERAARFVEDGYRCRTCNAVFLADEGHPQPECSYPNWDALTDEGKAEAIRALSRAAPSSEPAIAEDWPSDGTCKRCGSVPRNPKTGLCASCQDEDEPAIAEWERLRKAAQAILDNADRPGSRMCFMADGDVWIDHKEVDQSILDELSAALAQSSTPPASKGVDEPGWDDFCPKTFGETVLRAMNGRTCREVAPEVGISKATLNRVTLGKMPDLPTYFLLCRWLSVPAGILVLDGPKFSKLHALQHSGVTAAKPKIGGSIIAWAAEEIATLRAMLAASPTPSNDTLQGRGEVEQAYQQGQIDMRKRAAKVCDERGAEEQEGFGLNRATQNYFRARNAIQQLGLDTRHDG